MTTNTSTAAVGVFEDRSQACQAVDELKQAGFSDDQIGVAGRGGEDSEAAEKAAKGAAFGAAAGASVGVAAGIGVSGLWALGMAAGLLPGIGPVIAGGVLASILAGATGAGVAGGIVGVLVGLGLSEQEAQYYDGEFRSGRTVVTVQAADRSDEADAILRRFSAYGYPGSGATLVR